jgi:tRNA-specific 2-thiouridylase
MRDFLSEFIKPQKGEIVNESGAKLGEHRGAFSYTIGQRHGLGVGGGKPYFVFGVDTKANIVRVTADENSSLLNKKEFEISDCVWWETPKSEDQKAEVKVRYRSKSVPCTVTKSSGVSFKILLSKPERAITPGQSAVLYKKDKVIGGGIIQ